MKTLIMSICLSLLPLITFAQPDLVTKTGVIREMTCNGPSGLGMLKLENTTGFSLFGKNHHAEWIKVNSYDLCGAGPGEFTYLTSLGYDAVFLGDTFTFEVQIKDGFVVSAEIMDKIDYMDFMDGVKDNKVYNSIASHNWFLQGPTNIYHFNTPEEIKAAVEKFTSEDYLRSVSVDNWIVK